MSATLLGARNPRRDYTRFETFMHAIAVVRWVNGAPDGPQDSCAGGVCVTGRFQALQRLGQLRGRRHWRDGLHSLARWLAYGTSPPTPGIGRPADSGDDGRIPNPAGRLVNAVGGSCLQRTMTGG